MASLNPSLGASMDGQIRRAGKACWVGAFMGHVVAASQLSSCFCSTLEEADPKWQRYISPFLYSGLNRGKDHRNAHSFYLGIALLGDEVWSEKRFASSKRYRTSFVVSQTSSLPASPALALTLTWPVSELVWLPLLAYKKKKRTFSAGFMWEGRAILWNLTVNLIGKEGLLWSGCTMCSSSLQVKSGETVQGESQLCQKKKFEMGRVIVSSLEGNEFTGHSWQIEYTNVFNFSSFHLDQSALTL